MKKGQTEIIGLLVIVVMFIFVGLIYMMFAGKGDTTAGLTEEATQIAKARNVLDAYVQVTPCYTRTPYPQMDEIIEECYTSEDVICGTPCKELITGTLEEMMQAYSSKQQYIFQVLDAEEEEFISIGACPQGTIRFATASIPIKDLKLTLTFCILG